MTTGQTRQAAAAAREAAGGEAVEEGGEVAEEEGGEAVEEEGGEAAAAAGGEGTEAAAMGEEGTAAATGTTGGEEEAETTGREAAAGSTEGTQATRGEEGVEAEVGEMKVECGEGKPSTLSEEGEGGDAKKKILSRLVQFVSFERSHFCCTKCQTMSFQKYKLSDLILTHNSTFCAHYEKSVSAFVLPLPVVFSCLPKYFPRPLPCITALPWRRHGLDHTWAGRGSEL